MANIIYFDQDAIVGHHAKMPHLVRMFNSGQGSEKRPAVSISWRQSVSIRSMK